MFLDLGGILHRRGLKVYWWNSNKMFYLLGKQAKTTQKIQTFDYGEGWILGHVEIVVHSILLSCSMIVWKQSWHWVMMTFACKRRWRLWILLGCKGVDAGGLLAREWFEHVSENNLFDTDIGDFGCPQHKIQFAWPFIQQAVSHSCNIVDVFQFLCCFLFM